MSSLVSAVSCAILEPSLAMQRSQITEYEEFYKDRFMELAFEDPYLHFVGSDMVSKGFMTEEVFEAENKKTLEAAFNDPHRVKKGLMKDGQIVGYIMFLKEKEMSVETLKKKMQTRGIHFDEELIVKSMPNLKKTDAECREFALIESIVVTKEHRKKGYAKLLMRDAVNTIKLKWPHMESIRLNVNESNANAKKLYESEGFIISQEQPPLLTMMSAVQYEMVL